MILIDPITGQRSEIPDPQNQLNMMDILSIVSFYIGLKNYQENLSQSDKDDLMNKLDTQTKEILQELSAEIEKQNVMLERILKLLEEGGY